METQVLAERVRFVRAYESGQWSMSELCERYGVTRPTGYKWVARYQTAGEAGLVDQSRAPQACPHRTARDLEMRDEAVRQEYGWGAQKLLAELRRRYPHRAWPTRISRSPAVRCGHACGARLWSTSPASPAAL